MNQHRYVLEIDVIEAAGIEAIRRLSEKGNTVYIPIEEMEKRAALKEKDRYSGQFEDTLNFLTENGVFEKNGEKYIMPTGGIIEWKNVPGNAIHLTRDASIKSKLKRAGLHYEEPKFLHYGIETLKEGFIDVNYNLDPEEITLESLINETQRDYYNNTFIRLNGTGLIYLVKYPHVANSEGSRFDIDEDNGELIKIDPNSTLPMFRNFNLRNLEQKLTYSLLVNKDIELMIVSGGSGSGKTILSYVAAVEQILGNEKQRKNQEAYNGILLFKTNNIIGGKDREQGFLPGSAYEKVKPFMKSYVDSHKLSGMEEEILFRDMLADPVDEKDEFGKRMKSKICGLYLPAREKAIEVEHLVYGRGRTFEGKILMIDEAQNYTPFEMKQLIERVGVNSKIIIIGDPEQIDNPRLNKNYNGLVYAANINFNTHPRFAVSYLGKNYRSQSAEIMRAKKAPKD